MMNINFIVSACIEYEDTFTLIHTLNKFKRIDDYITVILDSNNTTDNMIQMVESFNIKPKFLALTNFSTYFDNARQYWGKDLLIMLCPDEIIPYTTIEIIRNTFTTNESIDAIAIPRINLFIDGTIENLAKMYVGNRGQDYYIEMQKKHPEGWLNWPDYQVRALRPEPYIKYGNTVHSGVCGYKNLCLLPDNPTLALIHLKTIAHQERMLKLYDKLEPT